MHKILSTTIKTTNTMKFKNIIAKTTFRTPDNATCGFAIAEHFGFTPKIFDHIVRVSVLLQKDETTNQLIFFLQSGNPILDSVLDKSFGSQDAFKPWLVEQQTLKWQDIQEFWDFYDDLVAHVQDDIQTNYKLLQPKANPQFIGPEIPISDIPDINDFRIYSDPKKEPKTVQKSEEKNGDISLNFTVKEKEAKVVSESINLFMFYFSGDIWVVRGLISDMQDLSDKYGIKNTIHLSKFFDKILNVLKLIDSLSYEADKN